MHTKIVYTYIDIYTYIYNKIKKYTYNIYTLITIFIYERNIIKQLSTPKSKIKQNQLHLKTHTYNTI